MNAIILDYDPFAMESRIYITDGEHTKYDQVTSDIDDAIEVILGLAYSYSTYNVKINAPTQMIGEFNRRIKEQELKDYKINQIKVGEI